MEVALRRGAQVHEDTGHPMTPEARDILKAVMREVADGITSAAPRAVRTIRLPAP